MDCSLPDSSVHGILQARILAAKSLQSCPTLCDPRDGSPPGSAIPGILQARTLEPFPSPMHESEKWKGSRSVLPTPSDPMDYSPPGSSIHGILQARALEWGAIGILHWSLRKASLSLLAILWNSTFRGINLSFSPLPLASLLYSAICKASSDNHFAFLHIFFLGMVLITASYTMSQTSVHSSSGTLSIRSNP